jgi:hypothetical protein
VASDPKNKTGRETAQNGEKPACSANVANTLSKNTYTKAIAIPKARLRPKPPLLFTEETATAISVKI